MNWKTLLNRQNDDNAIPRGKPWLIRFLLAMLRPVLRWYFPLTVYGRDNIPDDGNVMFASNHQSYLDPVFISCAMGSAHALNTCYLAKDKHFQSRFRRWFARSTRVMLVSPGARLREMMAMLGLILQSGHHLIIFPEGTRTPNGDIHEFKKTFALLAEATGTPIVPVLITGAYEAFPVGTKKPLRSPVSVRFLPPVQPTTGQPRELVGQVESVLRSALSEN